LNHLTLPCSLSMFYFVPLIHWNILFGLRNHSPQNKQPQNQRSCGRFATDSGSQKLIK
jgi:hypothetical protein